MRVGCWNVRTMYTVGKAAQIAREMERYRLDLLGLSEIRWTGGQAGLKPGLQQKTGLVGKRKLQPYATHGAERTN